MKHFGDNLQRDLDSAVAVYHKINDSIDQHIARAGIDAPPPTRYQAVRKPPADAPRELDFNSGTIAAVVWCIGFRTDFSWIEADIFDQRGYPRHERGVTDQPGLYFLGLPWQYTWGSGRFSGIARDAAYLAVQIVASPRMRASPA